MVVDPRLSGLRAGKDLIVVAVNQADFHRVAHHLVACVMDALAGGVARSAYGRWPSD